MKYKVENVDQKTAENNKKNFIQRRRRIVA